LDDGKKRRYHPPPAKEKGRKVHEENSAKRTSSKRRAAIVTTLGVTALGGAVAAGVLTATGDPHSASAGQVSAVSAKQAASPHCDPGWAVKVQRKTTYRKSTGERDILINKTKRTVKRTYTLTKQATTKYNVSGEVSVKGSAWVFAEVSAKISGGIEKGASITTTESDEVSVAPKTTVVVTRGFKMRKIYGNMYYTWSNCKTGKYKSFVLTAPYGRYTSWA
jgi:hypothetical protein